MWMENDGKHFKRYEKGKKTASHSLFSSLFYLSSF